ncbi:alpha/beta hydrolase [Microbacterium sp. JZ31]|uniref:alpha/beta hydrolase n=1 Tax=Microbacterium sp. JZ31 TaxID=1906274 RepID=UPI0019332482|nr:alpha/beta hydrolase [Microbacterium sp. JZ31]
MSSKRARRIVAWTLGVVGGVLVVAVAGIVIWSQVGVMAAEPEPLAAVQEDPAIAYEDTSAAIVLQPSDDNGAGEVGLVFVPGAKVDPWAYAAKLSDLVADHGITVVITRPWLNLAFFDPRPVGDFTALAPDVGSWMVGGHSLGGVRACQLAADADALVLFGSYCSADLSASELPVLSISGSNDGLSTAEKIEAARPKLPEDAEFVEIAGANHASFGDYGAQAGDGPVTIPDDVMTAELTALVGAFADR